MVGLKTDGIFPVLNRPFFHIWPARFCFRKNLETVRNVGHRFSESERKRGWCFSARIFGIPCLAGIFPDFYRISSRPINLVSCSQGPTAQRLYTSPIHNRDGAWQAYLYNHPCLHTTYWIRTLNPNYPRCLCNHSTQVPGSSIILKNLNPNHLWTILCVIVICEYKDVWYSGLNSDFRPFPLNFRPYWFVSVHPHIPVSFPNPRFPNPIPFPPKNVERK
jgi:hypothetical protein